MSTQCHDIENNFLHDRVILITGATGGIGSALSKALAGKGALVILLARNIKKLEQLYDEIEQLEGCPKPAIYPFDLASTQVKNYEALSETINSQFGRLDALIHTAGILGQLSPIEHYSFELWQQVLQVNLNSAFLLSKATLPLLKKSTQPSIIFTSAEVGKKARAYWGGYAVSQFGIQALMEILSDELEVNARIRVNVVQPKATDTKLHHSAYPGGSTREVVKPQEIVPYYLDLLHPNDKRNGETIVMT